MFDLKVLKSDIVYDKLKELIITNVLKQGTHLSERVLSVQLETSRTPVRDALKRLAADRFVVFTPDFGNVVSFITYERVSQIYDIREMLEALSVRLFATNSSQDEIEELTGIFNTLQKCTNKKDYTHCLEVDLSFHRYISTNSQNEQLTTMLDSIFEHSRRILTLTRYTDSWANESLEFHQMLLDLITKGDSSNAEEEMMKHVRNSKRHQLEKFLSRKK